MNFRKSLLVLGIFLVSMCMFTSVYAQEYIPKVDNFILLYDGSGSMKFDYQDTAEDKAVLAKKSMKAMNSDIPELDYQSGLVGVTPSFKVYQNMRNYDSWKMEKAISNLQEPQKISGLNTPLEKGLLQLGTVLDDLSGRTAVILFADGQQSMYSDALSAAKSLYADYDICLHVVSYAQKENEHALLNNIVALNDCSYLISGQEMANSQKRKDFVRKVFYAKDSDNDGVRDRYDECPGTPAGVQVDQVGCAVDSDRDGVADYKDKCPGTPAGVKVDDRGCPLDSDNDGVPNYKDECPGTTQGLDVDDQGCPVTQLLRLKILFATDKAEIEPEYRSELQRVATYLANHPDKEIKIEGHTDSVGSQAYNQGLSQRRADSVKQYLVREFGVEASRLMTKGYGETQPVATNETAQGRHKNRRVVCILPQAYKEK